MKKYVIEDYKPATHSDRAIQKASNLLLSYASLVFSENELNEMKKEQSLNMSNDEQNSIMDSSSMRQQISTGIGR